jgi:ankyrin repeat protein
MEMNDTGLPLNFEQFEYLPTRNSHSLDVDSYPGPCEDAVQGGNNELASCHDQSIPGGELSLFETESDLLCSRSHTTIHPAYRELRENRIRLLKILPIQADPTIRCRLEEFSLDDEPTYTAISYTWGSQHGIHAVLVNDTSLLVPKNLWRFLGSARAIGGDLSGWLWIDMLSINQADIPERGHQVSLMPVIFGTASLVNAWLGPAYLGSDAALIALARNISHWKSSSQRRKTWASYVGSGIRDLCQRPYWKRLWAYQELRLARQIQLMCGARTIVWDQFRLFLSLAETDLSAKIPRLSSFVQDSVDSPAMKMVKLNSKSVHTHLWSLIQATQHLPCADIRDKAYALLGVSTEGHGEIEPDYGLPIPTLINKILLEVYKRHSPKSLTEALTQCDELEDVLAVPRGTVFIIRGQLGSYEVPGEADFRACRLGPRKTSLNLWWTAFYGHVVVQRLLLDAWRAEYFASDPSVDESRLTWKDTAVARNLFRTCAVETLSLDPRLSNFASSFRSRHDAVEDTFLKRRPGLATGQLFPEGQKFIQDICTMKGPAAQSFKLLLAPGGFLASEDDGIADLLRAYAIHYNSVVMLTGLNDAGFVDNWTESRFFRPAILSNKHNLYYGIDKDPFLGIDAERISRYHHRFLDPSSQYQLPPEQILGKSLKNVVRLPLLSYLASRPTSKACVPYFLRHPLCDMDIRDENGWTPLIWAARYNNRGFVKMVLGYDEPICDMNYSDPNGWTALEHYATCTETYTNLDTDIMSMIISAKTFDHNALDSNGRTRLLRAIEICDIPFTKVLLKQAGCDPNVPDNTGRTPLTLAVSAWPWTRHSEDATAVSWMQPTEPENSDYMQQADVETREFEQGRFVTLLLRYGADVNLQDSSGRSALMIASTLGSIDLVNLLLRVEGCDLTLVSHNGDTAHSLALGSGHMEVVRLLEDDSYLSD